MPKDQNYCQTVTKTAEIFEKKHMITLLGIFIIDGPGYFLELSRKLKTDKKTLQERLKILLHHWLIQQELQMKGKKINEAEYQALIKKNVDEKVKNEEPWFWGLRY